jgi:CubicO group peptidase (beta-lactamase class C family)
MSKQHIILLILFCLQFTLAIAGDSLFVRTYKTVRPETTGLSTAKLSLIDNIVKEGLNAHAYPGCQVLVMKDGQIVYDRAFGRLTYENPQTISANTIYDLASLTKTTATLFAIMKLYDTGKLKPEDKASEYLKFLNYSDKKDITIQNLLFHTSGLPSYLNFQRLVITKNVATINVPDKNEPVPGNKAIRFKPGMTSKTYSVDYPYQAGDSLFLHKSTHSLAMQMIAETTLGAPEYIYSCVNFILLKEIAEQISGMSLDQFLKKEFYEPMGLQNLTYLPLRNHNADRIAPTVRFDSFRNNALKGYVHDPAAAFLGNISGNAGLFGNARDVSALYQMLLNGGELDGKRYLSEATCRLFIDSTSPDGLHGLGFAKPTPNKPATNPCGISSPMAVVGHTGYTGTCVWVDPKNNMIFVFLSNRTYPSDAVNKLARMKIRPRIHEQIYQSFIGKIKH